ncbi:ABC transporter permease [Thermanaerothrix sp.]|uniref:ABC transporter permease n=1 Tax=Thermanaerothrix sp. TaxID=2972675 RepID=UPI002ADE0363|nr:ABC transporter permease [Thermanaerothrix sp.]
MAEPDSKAQTQKPLLQRNTLLQRLLNSAPIYVVLIILLILVRVVNPNFFDANVFLGFLKRSAPVMILAAGQLFVIATGGFDLSMGSIILMVVLGGALLTNNDPTRTWWSILSLLGLGTIIGLLNGAITSFLRIPSFITTLGMQLVVRGAILLASGGAPSGYLPDNFRIFGRGNIFEVGGVQVPWALVVLVIVAAGDIFLMQRSNLGKQILAVGDNPRAAALAGVRVSQVRILAFILSAIAAVIAGILYGGFSGTSRDAGQGYELQAIAAVVLGGARLGGGQGSIPAAMAGALSLQALFTLLNLLGLPKPLRDAVEGLIIVGAAAYSAVRSRHSDNS